MAVTMSGAAVVPAARPQVWAMLNDPAVLKDVIPGCESLERTDDGFAAVAKVKIGPVSATFKGKVQLSDIAPNEGYTISGEGEGGVAGFARGAARVKLADADGGTMLHYDVDAHVGGKLAQLGSRLVSGVAKGMADKFFANFADAATAAHDGAGEAKTFETSAVAPTFETSAAAPSPELAEPSAPAPEFAEPAAPLPAAPIAPQQTSWFRRIVEWFMSLLR